MLGAVERGDARKLSELIGYDGGFRVNMDQDGYGGTLLHSACRGSDHCSPVIPLLLAHPDIDVNAKDSFGYTPFFLACYNGHSSCLREMLGDSRVNVHEPGNGCSPLWQAAVNGHVDVIRWWIASGREMELGKPGDGGTDAIGAARERGYSGEVTLLERFKGDPARTRSEVRMQLGITGQYLLPTYYYLLLPTTTYYHSPFNGVGENIEVSLFFSN